MALSDYCLCERCGRKTFYDANLHWDGDITQDGKPLPFGAGDYAGLCEECAKDYILIYSKRIK